MIHFDPNHWGLILGGSSGFGLATARKLSRHGMNLCIVHRDRRGAMKRIEPEFDALRQTGVQVLTYNTNALAPEGIAEVLDGLAEAMGEHGRVRMLLHSIAYGNLKLLAPLARPDFVGEPMRSIAEDLGINHKVLRDAVDRFFDAGYAELHTVATPPQYNSEDLLGDEDFALTIYSMGTSLATWVRRLFERRLFADDARVLAMTSEGNQIAWRGYAAVAAAKVALESVSRAIAVEYAPYGIRSNVIQAGVTDTPALRMIPGSSHMKAVAQLRNPFRRLTTPEDVANFICLMCTDEAAWVNGAILRVDGGEHISGS